MKSQTARSIGACARTRRVGHLLPDARGRRENKRRAQRVRAADVEEPQCTRRFALIETTLSALTCS